MEVRTVCGGRGIPGMGVCVMEDLIDMFCDECGTVTVHVDQENGISCTICADQLTDDVEVESLDEMREQELQDSTYVEGIDNWEEWN